MTYEQIFNAGKFLSGRLRKDYPLMLDEVNTVAQNDYNFTADDKKQHVTAAIAQLDEITTQLNNEIAAYRKALETFRG